MQAALNPGSIDGSRFRCRISVQGFFWHFQQVFETTVSSVCKPHTNRKEGAGSFYDFAPSPYDWRCPHLCDLQPYTWFTCLLLATVSWFCCAAGDQLPQRRRRRCQPRPVCQPTKGAHYGIWHGMVLSGDLELSAGLRTRPANKHVPTAQEPSEVLSPEASRD